MLHSPSNCLGLDKNTSKVTVRKLIPLFARLYDFTGDHFTKSRMLL